jgi:Meckel syndrome type 1 protein
MTAVAPPAAANPAMPTPAGAGGLVSPAAAFEAMLAAIFGQVDAQGAGLLGGGTKDSLLDATAADDGTQSAGDPSSVSAQAQSLVAALFAAATPQAPQQNGAPTSPGEGSGAAASSAAPAPAAGQADPALAALATTPAASATDGTGPKTADAAKTPDVAAGQAAGPAVAADPKTAPAPPATPTAPQAASAPQAGQVPQPGLPAGDAAPTRDARNDVPRRGAAIATSFASTQAAATTAVGPSHPPAAAASSAPTGPAAIAAAIDAAAKQGPDTDDSAPSADDSHDAHLTTPAAGAASAPPPTAGPAATPAPVMLRGAPETVANLAAQILKKLDSRSTRFDVELEPAGLGRVDVRLEIGAHGQVSAALAFDNPHTAQELKNRSGELTRALEQAGFDVSGGLSFDVAGDRGQSGRGGGFQQDDNASSAWRGRAFQAALDTTAEADVASPVASLKLRRALAAGVDIKI